jgi:hypothetical protein
MGGMGETTPSILVHDQNQRAPKRAQDPDRFLYWAFSILLLISFYYLSYRYPFQIGDAGSSPTYSSTPVWLQIGKYVLVGLVLIAVVLAKAHNRGVRPDLVEAPKSGAPSAFLFMGVWALAKGATVGSIDMSIVGVMMLIGATIGSVRFRWRLDPAIVTRHISAFSVIALVAEAIQIFLFVILDRLPALGYKDSISVRFGSLLDDPNTFGIMVALLIPTIGAAWSRRPLLRAVTVAALLACLLLTQSFTAAASVAVAFAIGWFSFNWRRPKAMGGFIIAFPALLGAIWYYVSTSAVVDEVLTTKAASMEDHANSWDVLAGLGYLDILGFGRPDSFIESSYVSLLVCFGAAFVLLYFGIGIAALARLHRIISNAEDKRTVAGHIGFYYYIIAFLIGSLNMQFEGIYPANILYVLGVCLSLFVPKKVSVD